jgi:hypothetical protein
LSPQPPAASPQGSGTVRSVASYEAIQDAADLIDPLECPVRTGESSRGRSAEPVLELALGTASDEEEATPIREWPPAVALGDVRADGVGRALCLNADRPAIERAPSFDADPQVVGESDGLLVGRKFPEPVHVEEKQ